MTRRSQPSPCRWLTFATSIVLFALASSFAVCIVADCDDCCFEEAGCEDGLCICVCASSALLPVIGDGLSSSDDSDFLIDGAQLFNPSEVVRNLYRPPRFA